MTTPSNPMMDRLFKVLGAPEKTTDVTGFIAEYRRVLDRYGPNVLNDAADRLIPHLGRQWPTVKQCVEACDEVVQANAGKAASARANKPQAEMPWDVQTEQAKAWAADYCSVAIIARQARDEGWLHQLKLYAQSFARERLRAGRDLPAFADWTPPRDVVEDYRPRWARHGANA